MKSLSGLENLKKTSAISRQKRCRLTIFTFLARCEIGSRIYELCEIFMYLLII